MEIRMEGAELLRIIDRHKARTLKKLEDINTPEAYLEVFRNGFGYLRNDLIAAAKTQRG
jgi:hypothetical protein